MDRKLFFVFENHNEQTSSKKNKKKKKKANYSSEASRPSKSSTDYHTKVEYSINELLKLSTAEL
jgi:hypothetical protein